MKLDPITEMLSDVMTMLEKMNYPTPLQLARALGFHVTSGPVASINLEPPPTIHMPISLTGFKRAHTLAHEIAHGLFSWRGIDDELLAYHAPECAYSNLEGLANYVAGVITMPPPVFNRIIRRYGFSPQSMIQLAVETGAPLPLAMDRVIFESDSYLRAALLFKQGLLVNFASTIWLEAELYDSIPDPAEKFPGIVLEQIAEHVVLGTWGD